VPIVDSWYGNAAQISDTLAGGWVPMGHLFREYPPDLLFAVSAVGGAVPSSDRGVIRLDQVHVTEMRRS
jgi:hypothetical protein